MLHVGMLQMASKLQSSLCIHSTPQHSTQDSTLALVVRHHRLWKTTESCFLALFFPLYHFLLMQMHLLHILVYLSLLGSLFAFEPCLGDTKGRDWACSWRGQGGPASLWPESYQALQKILVKPDEHEGCGAWESVGMDMLVCMSKIRFCFTTESLPVQGGLQLLLPSTAGGFPSIWRGCVVSVYSLSFISLPLGSDPAHAAPTFLMDEFGVLCSVPHRVIQPNLSPSTSQGCGQNPAAIRLSYSLGLRACSSRITCSVMGFCHLCQPLTLLI